MSVINLTYQEEQLRAEPLSDNTARIQDIPFFCALNKGDIVTFNQKSREVLDVEFLGSHTAAIDYPAGISKDIDQLRVEKIKNFLAEFEIETEQVKIGSLVVAVPLNLPFAKFEKICKKSPVPLGIVFAAPPDQEQTM